MCNLNKSHNHELETAALQIDQTFPREARLLDAEGYGRVFKRNRRVTNQYWIVLGHQSNSNAARLGLAIAKKRAKRAVDRNKIKRIARESFREKRAELFGIDAVVMNKDSAASASNVELRRSIDTLWLELASKLANGK